MFQVSSNISSTLLYSFPNFMKIHTKQFELEAMGQCIPPPCLTSVAIRIPDPDRHQKFNHLFTSPLPTFLENFMQIHLEVFVQSW